MSKQSIGQQLQRIKKLGLKRDARTGMLYTKASELRGKYRRVTLYGLFVSDENTFLLRPHVFESKHDARTPQEWRTWFAQNYNASPENPHDEKGRPGVLHSILAGMHLRTGGTKFWRLYKLIGWLPRVYLLTRNTRARDAGNKTKSQRKPHGHSDSRSGQRNAKRRADDVSVLQRGNKPARKSNRVRQRTKRHR